MKHKPVILSVGGSLIIPNQIDITFIRSLVKTLSHTVTDGYFFAIVVGGGATSRRYQTAAMKLASIPAADIDRIGIATTRLNAELVRCALDGLTEPLVFTSPHTKKPQTKPVCVYSGWQPGCSTDDVAVRIAARLKSDTVINISNTEFVYDCDPAQHANAKPLPKLTWREYSALIPHDWQPGMHAPFDPVAARRAARNKITVRFINGAALPQLGKIISGHSTPGTVITP